MYLCDKDIRNQLESMDIVSDDPEQPFNPETQIQPCSIDLRLSNVFWEPKRGCTIDLRRSALLKLEPRRNWKKRVLARNECITLKPGQLLLGRVCEEFTIPRTCAGKIEGRSSFARMGLSVHCAADFINPGYRGHMPLELVNHSVSPIKVFPYIPICQLMLIRLSHVPDRLYGREELQSKYMNDDGGPSYWWRDKHISALQSTFRSRDVTLVVQEEVLGKIGVQEPEIIERFERFVAKLPQSTCENASKLLEMFIQSEDKLRTRNKVSRAFSLTLFPLLASALIGVTFTTAFVYWHCTLWVATAASVWPFLRAVWDMPTEYLGAKESRHFGWP